MTLYSSAAASPTCFSKATLTYSFSLKKKKAIQEGLIPLICCCYSLGLNRFCFTFAEKNQHQSQSFLFTQNEEEELSGGCGFTINQVLHHLSSILDCECYIYCFHPPPFLITNQLFILSRFVCFLACVSTPFC